MAVTSCDACGGKMNSELAVCPHCGARRALTERPRWSKDEIHALLATDPGSGAAEPPRGLFRTLVMPHPATSGSARIAELILTGISLPLVIVGAAAVGISRRARRVTSARGELVPAVTMTVFGGLGLVGHAPLVAIGVLVVAMWTRAWVRARAGAVRGRDLMRIEPVAREPRPALAPARVVCDEPATARPERVVCDEPATTGPEPLDAPAEPAVASPAAAAQREPDAGPRLLR